MSKHYLMILFLSIVSTSAEAKVFRIWEPDAKKAMTTVWHADIAFLSIASEEFTNPYITPEMEKNFHVSATQALLTIKRCTVPGKDLFNLNTLDQPFKNRKCHSLARRPTFSLDEYNAAVAKLAGQPLGIKPIHAVRDAAGTLVSAFGAFFLGVLTTFSYIEPSLGVGFTWLTGGMTAACATGSIYSATLFKDDISQRTIAAGDLNGIAPTNYPSARNYSGIVMDSFERFTESFEMFLNKI